MTEDPTVQVSGPQESLPVMFGEPSNMGIEPGSAARKAYALSLLGTPGFYSKALGAGKIIQTLRFSPACS